MRRRRVVLHNADAGTGSEPKRLERRLRRLGLDAPVHHVHGRDLTQAAADAVEDGARMLVAAGGDGTTSAVAAAVTDTEASLGVLPVGTRNNFARDLGVPLRLGPAVRALRSSRRRRVDIGRVNGRHFINNVSIGVYPRWVARRELIRRRRRSPRSLTAMVAFAAVAKRYPVFDVRLALKDKIVRTRTGFLFVGNNAYTLRGGRIGARARLDEGQLSIVMAETPDRVDLLRLMTHAMLHGLQPREGLVNLRRPEAWVETGRSSVRVGTDGEVARLRTPLHFRSQARALRVVAPPRRRTS